MGLPPRDFAAVTRSGTVDPKVPTLRRGSCFPKFLQPRRASEKALVAAIQEACVGGLSTRDVDDLVRQMGMTGISKSQVSRLCAELDERSGPFSTARSRASGPASWLDATLRTFPGVGAGEERGDRGGRGGQARGQARGARQ